MEIQPITDRRSSHVSGNAALLAVLAGLVIGGSLLGLMGVSFVAATSLLVVVSPLLILFSPVLLGAAVVLALALLGFAAAGTMAVAGVSTVGCVLRPLANYRRSGQWLHSGGGVEEHPGKDWAGNIQHNSEVSHSVEIESE